MSVHGHAQRVSLIDRRVYFFNIFFCTSREGHFVRGMVRLVANINIIFITYQAGSFIKPRALFALKNTIRYAVFEIDGGRRKVEEKGRKIGAGGAGLK